MYVLVYLNMTAAVAEAVMDLEDSIQSGGLFYDVRSAVPVSADTVDCNMCKVPSEATPCTDSQYLSCSESKDGMTRSILPSRRLSQTTVSRAAHP